MKLYVAGGCSEHGRNCFYVKTGQISFLVDAGLMKEKPECPYPELNEKMIAGLDYLFLTHCHADHSGAIPWLYKKGFKGVVVATRETFARIKFNIKDKKLLERITPAMEEGKVSHDLYVTWGKTGHCMGCVWFLFRTENKKILFTGDYQEHSMAYACDKIRKVKADCAVIDCAYGYESEDAKEHRKLMAANLDNLILEGRRMMFPVPSHGRGFEVVRLLMERNVPVYVPETLKSDIIDSLNTPQWLKRKFIKAIDISKLHDISELDNLPIASKDAGRGDPIAFLVMDSQLYRQENRDLAEALYDSGGITVLTGKQDPSSFARKLLDQQKALFFRISVHQNTAEMFRLIEKNKFAEVIPYHCRQELFFTDKSIHVLQPKQTFEF